MESSESRQDVIRCPTCGHENLPAAAFCAQCGVNLRQDDVTETDTLDDTQATSVFEPIRSGDDRDPASLWSPQPPREMVIDIEPAGATPPAPTVEAVAASVATSPTWEVPTRDTPNQEKSLRGFLLGTLAILLITAVVGWYFYSAWLSDDMRNTVDGWLPWALART